MVILAIVAIFSRESQGSTNILTTFVAGGDGTPRGIFWALSEINKLFKFISYKGQCGHAPTSNECRENIGRTLWFTGEYGHDCQYCHNILAVIRSHNGPIFTYGLLHILILRWYHIIVTAMRNELKTKMVQWCPNIVMILF